MATRAAARAARLALFLVLDLLSCVLLLGCSFSSAVCSVTFDSTFPFLLHCSWCPSQDTWQHDSTISTTPKLHFKNTMVPYQLSLRLTLRNVAVRLFSDFSQCGYRYSTNTNVFTLQHTNTYKNIHAYIHTYRHSSRSTRYCGARSGSPQLWQNKLICPTAFKSLFSFRLGCD